MLKCAVRDLDKLFAAVSETMPLYLPTEDKTGTLYTKWEEGKIWSNKCNTQRGPKDLFFPQSEDLMAFKTSGKTIEVIDVRTETEDFAVFGVRACDVKALEVLDRVFLTEPRDSYYANRREHGIIISMACSRPVENCFCGTFGIDATEPMGDVTTWMVGEELYFRANTEKGEAFVKLIAPFVTEGDETAVNAEKEKIQKILARLPLAGVKADAFGGGKTDEFFGSPAWDKLSESCLGCGTCTFVCPTCQCYDIRDFKTGSGVVRYRCWDSCMYSEFTRMAHGNNRNSQKERFRQRFMHKLVYFPENNDGMFSCVGCGRCLAKCPISMNIVKVMKTLEGN